MTVLVAYASTHGSTREIAERIGERLTARHVDSETHAVDDVQHAERYSAYIVGSAIHSRAWLAEATDFVRANALALKSKPTWLFSVGMPGALRRPFRRMAAAEGRIVVAGVRDFIIPRGNRLFSGVVRREHLPALRSRVAFRLMACRYGDFRNWDEIDAWAAEIAGELQQENLATSRPPLQKSS